MHNTTNHFPCHTPRIYVKNLGLSLSCSKLFGPNMPEPQTLSVKLLDLSFVPFPKLGKTSKLEPRSFHFQNSYKPTNECYMFSFAYYLFPH